MKQFLRENWAWIVIPFVVTLVAVGLFVYSAGNSGGDEPNPFVYQVF